MVDLERLNEALKQLEVRGARVASQAASDGIRADLVLVFNAARAYRDLLANGERVEWCETHNAESVQNHGGMSDECWRVVWVDNGYGNPEEVPYSYDLCRIVSRLLVDPPKEEER